MNVKLFKKKDFLLLMLGKLVSLIGSEMQSFALSLYVLAITGSATKFASVVAITVIPKIILGPVAGVFADWFDRKKIIVCLDFINGIIIGIYAILFFINGELSMLSIYVLTIILATIELLFQPAISTVIPSIVQEEELVAANGVNSTIMNIGLLISPCIAGILFGIKGLQLVLIINSVSFILSAISEMFINVPKTNKKPEKINFKSFKKDFSEGLKFIKERSIIKTIIKLGMVLNFAFSSFVSVGLLYISKEILKVSDSQYGMMQSILVIGMFLAPVICAFMCKKMPLGKLIFKGVLISSVMIFLISICTTSIVVKSVSSNLILFGIITMLCIIFITMISAVNMALSISIQKQVPIEYLGRVSTVMNSLLMAIAPLGTMFFGILYDKIPAYMAVLVCASIMFIAIIALRKSLYAGDAQDVQLLSEKEKVYET
ncbi:MFS transporter [Clostridium senegalense]|uniref:MFS transporter n=1 Tax=Clostridium senegalense TaxID=1465809 RepID=UPI000287E1EA|nr:MFS transporter [Clostridium senegalense]